MSSHTRCTFRRAELLYVDRFRRRRPEAIEQRLGRDSSMHSYADTEGFQRENKAWAVDGRAAQLASEARWCRCRTGLVHGGAAQSRLHDRSDSVAVGPAVAGRGPSGLGCVGEGAGGSVGDPTWLGRTVRTTLVMRVQSRNSRIAGPNSASRNMPLTSRSGAVIAASQPSGHCCVERSQTHDAANLPAGRWPPDPLRQHDPVIRRTGRPLERSVRQPTGRSPAP